MSIYENMKLFADLRGLPASRIGEVLEKVGLADAGKRLSLIHIWYSIHCTAWRRHPSSAVRP